MKYFIIGGVTDIANENEKNRLSEACTAIGQALADEGHSLIICSPFEDSSDFWALKGMAKSNNKDKVKIDIHFIEDKNVENQIDNLENTLNGMQLIRIPHPAPREQKKESVRYAWLLCQLEALESCQAIIAIGGRIEGSANMLLLLAESKRKHILPLALFGGAASNAFQRRRYELQDRIGEDYICLQDERGIEKLMDFSKKIISYEPNCTQEKKGSKEPNVFISYSRARRVEADYVEMLLRRRNISVFRDESDFGAGCEIPTIIKGAIHNSNIFIVMWCAEYACSPWCFDEFELALDRREAGKTKILIFNLDNTRMVNKRARSLIYYPAYSRKDIEIKILEHIS